MPHFYTAALSKSGLSQTFKMPHRNIMQNGLFVAATDGTNVANGVPESPLVVISPTVFTFVIDESEGLVRIVQTRVGGFSAVSWSFNFEGYYHEWINDTDMRYFANKLFAEHSFRRPDFGLDSIGDAEENVLSLGTAVECCFALLTEFSRDIDINTADGTSVQATQRFSQVSQLLFGSAGIGNRYASKAAMMGVGLDRIEVLSLRRVSRSTNRLVPDYVSREWDDRSLPKRIFPPVDQGGPSYPPPSFHRSASVQGFYDGSGGGSAVPLP